MGRRPDIVLLVLDSLRYDHWLGSDTVATPTLDRLAEKGCVYTNVRSTASWTVPAMASVFSGQLPSEVGVYARSEQFNVDPAETLAGRAQSAGYDTIGVSANPWLTAEFGFDTGFDELRRIRPALPYPGVGDPGDRDWPERWPKRLATAGQWLADRPTRKRLANLIAYYRHEAPYANAQAVNRAVLKALNDAESPTFLCANYMDVHEPYTEISATGERETSSIDLDWNAHSLEHPPKTEPTVIRQAYADAVAFLDDQIGTLLKDLAKRGILKNAVLIVTSDHGQSLGEHGFWGHGTFLHESLIHVPMVVRPPVDWNDVPDRVDKLISLQQLFDLIDSCVGAKGASDVDIELEESKPAISESHGTPQDLTLSLPEDQSTHSRAFHYRNTRIKHLFEPFREQVQSSGMVDTETLSRRQEKCRNLHEELPSPEVTKGSDHNIKEETQRQLEQLGYV